MPYAEVAVDAPAGRPTYSYGVPDRADVSPGQLVWVPFGPRTVRGVVVAVTPESSHETTRPITSISPDIVLSPRQLAIASFISSRYLCSLFPALALFLPPGVERQSEVVYELAESYGDSMAGLSGLESDLVRRVREQGRLTAARLRSGDDGAGVQTALASLVERGVLVRRELPHERRAGPRNEFIVYLTTDAQHLTAERAALSKARTSRQLQLVEHLIARGGSASSGELRATIHATPATLRALQSRGLVQLEERRVWRQTLSTCPTNPSPVPVLTSAQTAALEPIVAALDSGTFSEHLVFGVTGSGKTEVYLRAAGHALATGRQAICLVPEIALAAQTVERFVSRFPGRVALLHSGLTAGQQFDEWERVNRGNADIVVGPRSALFAPLHRPGLIVLDEEHEWTYKQDDVAPRYHARDVAREIARATGAVLLLGSATPDVGTFHRAVFGETQLLPLPDRIGGTVGLPPVEVVDMRDELRSGNSSLFSRALQSAIAETLSRQEQVLLFLNRRGTATLVQCRHCGHVFSCPRCSVALAHHSVRDRLVCHRCGYVARIPELCPRCRSRNIRFLGIGTQRVAEQVKESFPSARVIRWDSDVPAIERGGPGLRDAVRGGHVDVVVGTQMVAKGHDFPGVTLVGVISADVGLGVPDYRSSERAFQLISQASGRAGRGVQPGRVVVQTYEPDNYVIQSAASHDYRAFYEAEIRYRREAYYPPFCSMVSLMYSHPDEDRCRREVERVHGTIVPKIESTDLRLTGPSPAFVRRLRGRYRWHITLRGSRPSDVLADLGLPRGWVVDVDPASVA
jgi:primosomal protein N' (replication factor Y)